MFIFGLPDQQRGKIKFVCAVSSIGGRAKENPMQSPFHRQLSHGVLFSFISVHENLFTAWIYSLQRMCGNSKTSRMDALSVSSMISLSTPMPSPPVGGKPNSSAVT